MSLPEHGFPTFDENNYHSQVTGYGKYNYSTKTYYHPSTMYAPGSQPGPGEIYCTEQVGSPTAYSESRDSPTQSTRVLRIVGTYDRRVALECVRGWLSLNLMTKDGNIPLRSKSLSMTSEGAAIWECTLEYSDPQRDDENVYDRFCEVSMTTTGGSVTTNTSIETVTAMSAIAGVPYTNYNRLINVDKDGTSQGVEIKASTVHLNVALNWPDGTIDEDYLINLAEMSPSVNSTYWFGFAPGALLFEGANVDRITCTDPYDNSTYYRWKISYTFIGERNMIITEPISYLSPLAPNWGSYIIVPKRGWDLIWRSYATTIIDGLPQTVLQQVNVEQMYQYIDFADLNIPSSLFI